MHDVAEAFDLGEPTGRMVELAGGRAHRIWKLDTDRGSFVVKRLNPDLVGRPGVLGVINDKIRLELAAFEDGVVMAEPIRRPDGAILVELTSADEPKIVRVHRCVNGRRPTWSAATEHMCSRIGRALAVSHRHASVRDPDLPSPPPVRPQDAWVALAERGAAGGRPWADELAAVLPVIEQARDIIVAAVTDVKLVRGHGEIDQRNVLLADEDEPVILDWDGVLFMDPTAELVTAAMHWSGVNVGEPDPSSMTALISGYHAAGGRLESLERRHFGMWLAYELGWTSFAAQISLGDDVRPVVDDDVSADEHVQRRVGWLPGWLDRLDEWLTVMND